MTNTLARAADSASDSASDSAAASQTPATAVEALSTEIRELAARISVATARLLRLIGEFDAVDGWNGHGVKSCAHWLSWHCHLSLHTAREQVRVARRLRELPLIEQELATGGLSYAKVRALTRIADHDSEADLVSLAKAATAAQVERTVAGWRRTDTLTPDERVQRRHVTWHFDDDGMLRLTARLDADEGARLVAALEAARARLGKTHPEAETSSDANRATEENIADPIDPANPADAADPTDAADPAPSGRPSTPPAADALAALADTYLSVPVDAAGHRVPTELIVSVDADVLEQRARGGIAAYQTGGALTERQVRQFACDTTLVSLLTRGRDILDVGRARRTVPRRIRRALQARDGGCAMPGCAEHRPHRLHAHHVVHWADGGPTALHNLVLLCTAHHWAVHHDLVSIHADAGRFTYRAPDGTILEPVPATPALRRSAQDLPFSPRRPETPAGDRFDLDYILSVLHARRLFRQHQGSELAA